MMFWTHMKRMQLQEVQTSFLSPASIRFGYKWDLTKFNNKTVARIMGKFTDDQFF